MTYNLNENPKLTELNKYFDCSLDQSNEFYNILTVKDKKKTIPQQVWYQIKIQKDKITGGREHWYSYNIGNSECNLENVLDLILPFSKNIIDEFNEDNSSSLSIGLFDFIEDKSTPLEIPKNLNTSKKESLRKENLIKKYDYLTLTTSGHKPYLYTGIDYRKDLPSQEEFIELFKENIVKIKNNLDFYIENYGMTNKELLQKVLESVNFGILPYRKYEHINVFDSFYNNEVETYTDYRYRFSNGRLKATCPMDNDKYIIPEYDLSDKKLIAWLREELLNRRRYIPTDKEMIDIATVNFMDKLVKDDECIYDWKEKILGFEDSTSFKKDVIKFYKNKAYENLDYYHFDDGTFKFNCFFEKDLSIKIWQDEEVRNEALRSTVGAKLGSVLLTELKFDEIIERVFEMHSLAVAA